MVFTSVTDRLGNAAGSAVGAVSGRFRTVHLLM